MRTITVLNAKGGCGKTTIATCLASYYASRGKRVALADYDQQASSSDWLASRSEGQPEIIGLRPDNGSVRPPQGVDYLIVDAPAATHGREMSNMVRRAETLIVPVLPSPIDMRAAYRFLNDLYRLKQIDEGATRVGLVANRVKENTLVYRELTGFVGQSKVPFVARLRETQNYNRASQRGVGIMEMPPYLARKDHEQFKALIRWLNSKRSRPAG